VFSSNPRRSCDFFDLVQCWPSNQPRFLILLRTFEIQSQFEHLPWLPSFHESRADALLVHLLTDEFSTFDIFTILFDIFRNFCNLATPDYLSALISSGLLDHLPLTCQTCPTVDGFIHLIDFVIPCASKSPSIIAAIVDHVPFERFMCHSDVQRKMIGVFASLILSPSPLDQDRLFGLFAHFAVAAEPSTVPPLLKLTARIAESPERRDRLLSCDAICAGLCDFFDRLASVNSSIQDQFAAIVARAPIADRRSGRASDCQRARGKCGLDVPVGDRRGDEGRRGGRVARALRRAVSLDFGEFARRSGREGGEVLGNIRSVRAIGDRVGERGEDSRVAARRVRGGLRAGRRGGARDGD
jgi:hypothetical protein